ncbi:hypothetical protein FORC36_1161 [Vibrio vulnificus]|uniref:Uncharacterized protein n=1 Tax=Vibrio vulnificus TaxID=672 RepID=A0AAN1PNV2_VIBVL|nr:hypothetical protein FORC9_1655 [Vibrio vulnificus]ANH63028.1 hypothetical protein FORC16_1145 [Vibrio vulnificus]ANN26856.1 hypothetical protein FORC17_1793 [Vibrio vulnificus]ARN65678.1 hypothetical protein FORC36_1161 [Vibrio vulnificus]AXX60107.1 hypothetical protein FORC53_1768 [Vibrio vulnificus]
MKDQDGIIALMKFVSSGVSAILISEILANLFIKIMNGGHELQMMTLMPPLNAVSYKSL